MKAVTDYVKNPAKTNGGILITGFECDPDIVAEDFMFSRDEYLFNTGREQGENEILAYHVRQSFVPGEITDVDMVNKLGYELAMELTGSNHSFIVCTHTDKLHLHNHVIINAVNLDCDKKFRNEFMSYKRVQEIADCISAENNLHVIKNPNLSKGTQNRYKKQTKRDGFVVLIDKILFADPPKDFDDFLKRLEKNGCKIRRRGKTISVRPPGAERFLDSRAAKKVCQMAMTRNLCVRKLQICRPTFKMICVMIIVQKLKIFRVRLIPMRKNKMSFLLRGIIKNRQPQTHRRREKKQTTL